MLPEKARIYPMSALESAPVIFETLMAKYGESDKIWDFSPKPNRFTLREVTAHVADWDKIFKGRVTRIVNEDKPTLEDLDESKIAKDNNYKAQNPIENIARWKANRADLSSYLKSLQNSDFERTGIKQPLGEVSVAGWLSLMTGHDMYHLRQAVDYIKAYESGSTENMQIGWNSTSPNSPIHNSTLNK